MIKGLRLLLRRRGKEQADPKAAARAAKLRSLSTVPRVRRRKVRRLRNLISPRLLVCTAWAGACSALGWAAHDVFGPAGSKVAASIFLLCLGGIRPFVTVCWWGLAVYPLRDWEFDEDAENR